MNILEHLIKKFTRPQKLTPAEFRRGVRKHRVIGYSIDKNLKHDGTFKGSITPMRRRFKGVSRTTGK
jgi:hypothetical protein